MFGWLAKKGEHARIYMCVKELSMALEAASGVGRAKILALASLLRTQLFCEEGLPMEVLERPMDFQTDHLFLVYEGLEEIRNHNIAEISVTKKRLAQFGMSLPAATEKHAKNTSLAVEVWMATLASEIVTERRNQVRNIWKMLHLSRPHLEDALDEIVHTESQTASMFGGPERGPLASVDRAEWLDLCEYYPPQFALELA